MKIKLNKVEKAIITGHAPSCRGRALLEMEIVSALLRQGIDTGYSFKVEDEEDDVSTSDKLKQVVFNLGEIEMATNEPDVHPGPYLECGCIYFDLCGSTYGPFPDTEEGENQAERELADALELLAAVQVRFEQG
jgi:hypothetical protein